MSSFDVAGVDAALAEDTKPCPDPECGGVGESDQDGDHLYWACRDCGYEFAWEKVPTDLMAVGPDGSCSAGIPAATRRVVSGVAEDAMARMAGPAPVLISPTIGRRPGL